MSDWRDVPALLHSQDIMTHADLLTALLVEQFGHPTPEHREHRPPVDSDVWPADRMCAERRRVLHAETMQYERDNPDTRTHRRMRVVA